MGGTSTSQERHHELTAQRLRAFAGLFGCDPIRIWSSLRFIADERFPIDVLVYPLLPDGSVVAAVTNGLSDQAMAVKTEPGQPATFELQFDGDKPKGIRREVIQYFHDCTEEVARFLHHAAWAPLAGNFTIDTHQTYPWDRPAVEGTPWKNPLFLPPIVTHHHAFRFEVDGETGSLLWLVPISDAEQLHIARHGLETLLDRMAEVRLSWIFDAAARPGLVDSSGTQNRNF